MHVQFHWYGFFIGIAVVTGLYLTEYLLKRKKITTDFYWPLVTYVIVGGLLGSRAWHVATAYQLYVNQWWNVFAIWNGGLSIIGTIFGAAATYFLFFKVHPEFKRQQLIILDICVFGLALAQAIGRLGNYTNQELYGLPSNLPWAILIDKANRFKGFEQFSTFHPLFAYEAILLLIFLGVAFLLEKNIFKIGTGKLFAFYVFYYSWIRFLLDFLRIDKASSPILGLGLNQIVLLVTGALSGIFLVYHFKNTQLRAVKS